MLRKSLKNLGEGSSFYVEFSAKILGVNHVKRQKGLWNPIFEIVEAVFNIYLNVCLNIQFNGEKDWSKR